MDKLYDVVILGGGISGLTAAYELKKSGLYILLLERNSRIGGRIYTVNYGDNYAESGAMVVTSEEKRLLQLIQELGTDNFIKLGLHGTDIFWKKKIYHLSRTDGKISSFNDLYYYLKFYFGTRSIGISSRISLKLFHDYKVAVEKIKKDVSGIVYPYDYNDMVVWDNIPFSLYIEKINKDLIPFFDLQLKVTAGNLSSQISTFWGLITASWNAENFYWIQGGTSKITDALAESLNSSITLKANTISVTLEKSAKIKYTVDNELYETKTRTVVMAMPPKDVLDLKINLPSWKEKALKQVPFAKYISVHHICRQRFWKNKIKSGYFNSYETIFSDLIDGTKEQKGTEGILIGFITEPESNKYFNLPDGELIEHCITDLEKIFPNCKHLIKNSLIFRWDQGIPYMPVNYSETYLNLQKPCEPVFFCGDYTQGAGLNDAAESGIKVSQDIIRYLNK